MVKIVEVAAANGRKAPAVFVVQRGSRASLIVGQHLKPAIAFTLELRAHRYAWASWSWS